MVNFDPFFRTCKKFWNFLWHEDSLTSWIVSIIIAFILVKFIVYPLIGLALGTGFPIVAVVSESMEHRSSPVCLDYKGADCVNESNSEYTICGQTVEDEGLFTLQMYWDTCGDWYKENNISKKQFSDFPFENGFNKGDIMVLVGEEAKDINIGDVVVFDGGLNYPIIHRVVDEWAEDEDYYLNTKGDNNEGSSSVEMEIGEERIYGKAVFRLPLLGWVKILFNSFIENLVGVFR